MEKRLLRALESRRSDFAREGVDLDLWSREAFLRTIDHQGVCCTITISTAFADTGFYISVQGVDHPERYPEMHQIREPGEILGFLERRISQLQGKDPAVEVILPLIEAWTCSPEDAQRWYRKTPIPALGSFTAQQLVARGRADDVLAYLEHIDHGGYA
jgi:hypothetical protein